MRPWRMRTKFVFYLQQVATHVTLAKSSSLQLPTPAVGHKLMSIYTACAISSKLSFLIFFFFFFACKLNYSFPSVFERIRFFSSVYIVVTLSTKLTYNNHWIIILRKIKISCFLTVALKWILRSTTAAGLK